MGVSALSIYWSKVWHFFLNRRKTFKKLFSFIQFLKFLLIPETASIKPSLSLLELSGPDQPSFLRNPSHFTLDPSFLTSLEINMQKTLKTNEYPQTHLTIYISCFIFLYLKKIRHCRYCQRTLSNFNCYHCLALQPPTFLRSNHYLQYGDHSLSLWNFTSYHYVYINK